MLEQNSRRLRRAVARAALPLVLGASFTEAQTGRLAGTITEQQSGAGLAAASIIVRGTRLGAVSQDNGRYVVNGITPGTYTIEVRRVGYTADIRVGIIIGTDETKLDVALSPTAIRLSDMVVTGVTDPIAAEKLPFSVGKISRDEMPIPVVTTSAILQGKVAGVTIVKGDGQPGSGSSVMLRSPTAITKSNSPLYVVDGVVLGSTFSGTTVDLDALDIESVEVVKGAAAASLYGSRAASGVVQIKTVSGKRLAEGRTQVTLRSEYGYNQLGKELSLNTHHWFRQNASGSYLDANGNVTTSTATAAAATDRISDKIFPWDPLESTCRHASLSIL